MTAGPDLDLVSPPTPADGLLPDQWYIARRSSDLGTVPQTVLLGGTEIGLWRDERGDVHAQPARTCEERDGYLWVWTGAEAPSSGPLAIADPFQGRGVWVRLTQRVKAGFLDSVENTVDLIHPLFAHPWTHPLWWAHRLGIQASMRVVITPDALGWTAEGFMWGRRIMWQEVRLPDRVRLLLLPDTALATDAFVHHVPETPAMTRFEILLGRRCAPWERPGATDGPQAWLLHRQDRVILEALQRCRTRHGPVAECHARADAYTLLFRRIFRLAQEGRWQREWSRHSTQREVVVRV